MNSLKHQLTITCIQILRPLIRILLRNNISHSEFVEITKRAYVDVASRDFCIPGKPKTVSHTAVVTGLSRKEVLRIQKLSDDDIDVNSNYINRASRVIAGWLHNAEFQDDNGESKALPLKGERASFEALVKQYSGDITWGAVFNELERTKSVLKNEKDEVVLIQKGYIPSKSEIEKYGILGECGTDLMETFAHNLEKNQTTPRFQRSVSYNYIPENLITEFENLSAKKSEKLLLELNQWLANNSYPLKQKKKSVKYFRIGLGIYYFENDARGSRYYEK